MRIKIKICGITQYEDARIAVNLGVDALGFVFSKSNQRYIDPKKAYDIIVRLPPFISKVGVFFDEDLPEIVNACKTAAIDTIQLNGNQPPELVNQINLPVIKTISIDEQFNPAILDKYNVSAFLLSLWADYPSRNASHSDTNWDRVKRTISVKKNIVLSGQIGITNVKEAIEEVEPYGVDIIDSVEIMPGVKNPHKMRDITKIVQLCGQAG
jgi:phosphoribosylanthranilate isomerase